MSLRPKAKNLELTEVLHHRATHDSLVNEGEDAQRHDAVSDLWKSPVRFLVDAVRPQTRRPPACSTGATHGPVPSAAPQWEVCATSPPRQFNDKYLLSISENTVNSHETGGVEYSYLVLRSRGDGETLTFG
jgi:hypothetical protein